MLRRLSRLLTTSTLAASTLVLGAGGSALAHNGGHGGGGHGGGHAHTGHAGYNGYHGGAYHGGAYHGGAYHNYYHHGYYGPYRPYGYGGFFPGYGGYGFYRPYYGYGYGLGGLGLGGLGLGGLGMGGLGMGGLGLGGLGMGGYGLGGYGMRGYGGYAPYYGGYSATAPVVALPGAGAYAAAPAGPPPTGQEPPMAPDNAAHLQLLVPENAVVLFEGDKTTQTGATREFVSPPVPEGKVWTYTISVRYSDPSGKPIDDTRRIHVRANDWFRIDFTRPAPPENAPAPLPQP